MKARDVMTAKVISVSPETPVRDAARVLDFPGGMRGDVGLFLLWGQ
jgi:hypothetical protein